ncbi:MAG: DUF2937 family protein [Gallionella sp.]|jgi:hypothetical protein
MAHIREILDRVVLVAGVIGAGCIPSFIAQYRQRVGGMLTQVLQDLAPFQLIADKQHQGSIQKLVQHHVDSSDPTFYNEGAAIQSMVDSAEQLRLTFKALDTDLFHQLSYLLTKIDPLIARATWDVFSPSFGLSVESLVFGSAVGVLIWLTFLSAWYVIERFIRTISAR